MKYSNLTITTIAAIVVLASINPIDLLAQKQLNFGLTQKQPTEALPKGKTQIPTPVLKSRSNKVGNPISVGNSKYLLNNGWELTDDVTNMLSTGSAFNESVSTQGWYDAVVPGTVLTSLVAAGKYPDPYYGLNNLSITDSLCRKDWWYRTTFESPANENGKLAWLNFNGINYRAKIWLNGKYLGDINGAFARGTFKVTDVLKKAGRNVLLVQIIPPSNPGIPDEQSALSGMGKNGGVHTLDGPTFFATEGWDWLPGIRDRNIGIWQDVQLYFTGNVTSSDPQIITDLPLPDTSNAAITLKTTLVNNTAESQEATVQFSFEGVLISKKIKLAPQEVLPVALTPESFKELKIKNPKLWWPNGYGLPNLYNATIKVIDAKGLEDVQQVRFGIREYSYELLADTEEKKSVRLSYSPTDMQTNKPIFDFAKRREFKEKIHVPTLRKEFTLDKMEVVANNENPFLVIKVNGKRIFCKGGNWGLDDGMKKVSRENLEPAFQLHKNSNFNLIRNWTGESTEPVFFELADEYGMLVWNDFWLSTEGFNLNPADDALFLANSLEMIKRYRNHASIAIWCPRNEGYAPVGIENNLATQIAVEDGTRHYHGNSREMNLRPSGPWHFFVDNKDYFTKHGKGFTTEIGTFSVPEASSIRKFIGVEDEWPINDVWHYHDLHTNNQNLEGYLKTIDSLYGTSKNLDEFNKKVQLVNYESHRAIFEAWNANLWKNSSGVLLWMSHPAWPSMIWQTYSWDFQTHGSYFGSKKGCEPLHIQMNLNNNKVIVVNTSLEEAKGVVATMQVFSTQGKLLHTQSSTVDILANEKTDLFDAVLDNSKLTANYFIRLTLTDKKGRIIATNEYWKAQEATGHFKAFNELPQIRIASKVTVTVDGKIIVELENKNTVPAIGIKLDALDKSNQILLPAYFNDGYFTLLPKEKKTIVLETVHKNVVDKIKIAGYNVADIVPLKK